MGPTGSQQFWYNGQHYTIEWITMPPVPEPVDVMDRLIEATLSGMTTFPEVQALCSRL